MNFKKLTAVICACLLLGGCSGCSLFKPTLNSVLLNLSAVLAETESVDFDLETTGTLESETSLFNFSSDLSALMNIQALTKEKLAHVKGSYSFTLFDYPLDSETEIYFQGGKEENTLYVAGNGSQWTKTTMKNKVGENGDNIGFLHIFKVLTEFKDDFVLEEETRACPYRVGGVEKEDENRDCYLVTGTVPGKVVMQVADILTEKDTENNSDEFSVKLDEQTFQVQLYVDKESSEPAVLKMWIEEPVEISIPQIQQYLELDTKIADTKINLWFNSFNGDITIQIPEEALNG